MTVQVNNILIDELTKQLGDRNFYTIRDLKTLGYFGSLQAVRMALREGKIAYIKISPRRSLIPRVALIDYLRNNLSENLSTSSKGDSCSRK